VQGAVLCRIHDSGPMLLSSFCVRGRSALRISSSSRGLFGGIWGNSSWLICCFLVSYTFFGADFSRRFLRLFVVLFFSSPPLVSSPLILHPSLLGESQMINKSVQISFCSSIHRTIYSNKFVVGISSTPARKQAWTK